MLRVATELDPKGVQSGAAAVKRSLKDVDVAMSKTEKSTKGMSANFGQAGIQVQQFVGQIQGGQSAMLALSQQSADLGIVLGAPMVGVIAGLSASIVGMLLPSLMESTDATKELELAQERLSETLEVSEDGVITYTDKIARLAQVSEQAARVQIAASIADATEVIRNSANIVDDVIESYEGWFTNINAVSGQLESLDAITKRTGENQISVLQRVGDSYEGNVAGIGILNDFVVDLGKEFGTSAEQSLELARALTSFEKTPQGMTDLADTVATLAEETGFSNTELNKLAKELQDSAADGVLAQQAIDLLNKSLKDTSTVVNENTESFSNNRNILQSLGEQLVVLTTEYEQGGRAAEILEQQQRAGVTASSGQGRAIAVLTGQIYDQREAIGALADAERKKAEQSRKDEADRKKAERDAASLTGQVDQIAFGTLSPVEQLREEERLKIAVLDEYALLGAEQEKRAQELRTSVAKQGATDRNELARMEQNNTVGAISGGFDALANLSSQFIGDQDNQNKTAFALSKAFATASASMNLWLAVSQAMADPSALTLGQKLGNYAAIASAGAGLVSNISSAKYATGGFVEGGGTGTSDSVNARLSSGEFVVRESVTRRNRSALESLNSSGQMPSNGGSGVTINYYGTGEVTQQQGDNGDLIVTIDERINKRVPTMIGSEISNPNSKASRSLRSNYQMTRS